MRIEILYLINEYVLKKVIDWQSNFKMKIDNVNQDH